MGIETGSIIGSHYDAMLAKYITFGECRSEALRNMEYCLSKSVILGVKTNQHFLRSIVKHSAFNAGDTPTDFLEQHGELFQIDKQDDLHEQHLLASALYFFLHRTVSYNNKLPEQRAFQIHIDDKTYRLTVACADQGNFSVHLQNTEYSVSLNPSNTGDDFLLTINDRILPCSIVFRDPSLFIHIQNLPTVIATVGSRFADLQSTLKKHSNQAEMPGQIIEVLVDPDQVIKKGQTLMVMESMKMEHKVTAMEDGRVSKVLVKVGDLVEKGKKLFDVSPIDERF